MRAVIDKPQPLKEEHTMNTQSIAHHTAAIEAKHAELQMLLADQERARAASQSGAHASVVSSLQAQRVEELGHAFLAGRDPELTSLDKRIAAAHKAAAEANLQADAASAALVLLQPKIAEARDEIAAMQIAQVRAAVLALDTQHEAAKSAYLDAVNALLDTVADLEATARLRDALSKRIGAPSDLSNFARVVVRDQLELPIAQRDGTWHKTGEHHTRWGDRLTPRFKALADELAGAGVNFNGGVLVPPKQPAPEFNAVPIVRITQLSPDGVQISSKVATEIR